VVEINNIDDNCSRDSPGHAPDIQDVKQSGRTLSFPLL
jgi:hypothetical protein